MKSKRSSAVVLMVTAFGLAPACGGLTRGEASDGGPVEDTSSSSSGGSSGGVATSGSSGGSASSSGVTSSSSSGASASSSSGSSGGTATCGTLMVVDATDAGVVENFACEMCISGNCQAQECQCTGDTVPGADGALALCGTYVQCVYTTFLQNLASSDAGTQGEGADLGNAEATCQPGIDATSMQLGNTLVGCIAANCVTACVHP